MATHPDRANDFARVRLARIARWNHRNRPGRHRYPVDEIRAGDSWSARTGSQSESRPHRCYDRGQRRCSERFLSCVAKFATNAEPRLAWLNKAGEGFVE